MLNFRLPIPRQWSKHIKSAFIHTISLVSTAFTSTCALASKRRVTVTRLKAELAQAYHEISLLEKEVQIKDERFIRTMKNECTRKIPVTFRLDAMRRELTFYTAWYNEYGPHTYLVGRTPQEVYEDLVPANTKPRLEPRPRWPHGSPCAAPHVKVKGQTGVKFVLTVTFMENRRHLPVMELYKVA